MFLEYLALVILLIVLVAVFYAFIYIHDLPHEIAKERKHPQTEAIHVACWLSLFTLHAIWPIVFIWAISKPKPGGEMSDGHTPEAAPKPVDGPAGHQSVAEADLALRVQALEEQVKKLTNNGKKNQK